MKIAIVGSRNLKPSVKELSEILPSDITEIISGGARGVDTAAKEYARCINVKYTEFLPDYERYGKAAPILRNEDIVSSADEVYAFWDGVSRGTGSTISLCKRLNKKVHVILTSAEIDKQ